MNILILTTKENFKWTSMQEIIPSIEEIWLELNNHGHAVKKVCVDDLDMKTFISDALWADKFVITAFNLKIVRAFEIVKKSLQHSGQTFFYVHNMATIGCWPLNYWGLSKYLTTNDIFVVSCTRDIESLKSNYSNCRYILTPFTYTQKRASLEKKLLEQNDEDDFVYIGRLSAQKNLHSLIWAFSEFHKKNKSNSRLIIFGKEDDLGSPNMGMKCSSYEQHLRELSEVCEISDKIDFRGFVDRDVINSELETSNYIMISTSLHSDENFGMAAFNYLINGKRCILSNWGGHNDYLDSFSDQLELITVKKSQLGPVVSAFDIEKSLKNSFKKKTYSEHFPEKYCISTILKTIQSNLSNLDRDPLEIHEHSKKILENQNDLSEEKYNEQIFRCYQDELSHVFFAHYGMIENDNFEVFDRNFYKLAPWLKILDGKISGQDFHKGVVEYKVTSGKFPIVDYMNTKIYVSEKSLRELLSYGYLFLSNLDLNINRYFDDKCATSINILKDRVTNYLSQNGITNIYFPDSDNDFPTDHLKQEVNIVLFGGFLKRILESGCWDFNSAHFWVLCTSVKKTLVELFDFPSSSISVINRESLFNISKVTAPSIKNGTDFVYAGRLSRVKNLDLLVWSVYYLQTEHNLDIKLNLIGGFEDSNHDYLGFINDDIYEKELSDLIESIDWKFSRPVIVDRMNWTDWPKLNFQNPHYISLSSFLGEDFAVSVAQAQELSWPCILSAWGGHRNVLGATLIPMNYVLPFLNKNVIVQKYAKNIASYILNSKTNDKNIAEEGVVTSRSFLSIEDLGKLRREFVTKSGKGVLHLLNDEGWKFSVQESGKAFYQKLIDIFGEFSKRSKVILVKEGFNETVKESHEMYSYLEGIDNIEDYEIVTVSSIFKKSTLPKILEYESIFLGFDEEEGKKAISFLRSLIPNDKIHFLKRHIK
jgi:glycosyltransferase involved in cell wall biosynthesis